MKALIITTVTHMITQIEMLHLSEVRGYHFLKIAYRWHSTPVHNFHLYNHLCYCSDVVRVFEKRQ